MLNYHVHIYVNKKKKEITKLAYERIVSTLSFLSSSVPPPLSLPHLAFFFFSPLSPPSVCCSRLTFLICEFLSRTFSRYPVFSHASFPSFLLFLVTSHSSGTVRFTFFCRTVSGVFSRPLSHPRLITLTLLPLTPLFSTTSVETYFLETSEFICSCPKSPRFNRSSVRRVSTHEIRICTPHTYVIREIAFATARTHTDYDDVSRP